MLDDKRRHKNGEDSFVSFLRFRFESVTHMEQWNNPVDGESPGGIDLRYSTSFLTPPTAVV